MFWDKRGRRNEKWNRCSKNVSTGKAFFEEIRQPILCPAAFRLTSINFNRFGPGVLMLRYQLDWLILGVLTWAQPATKCNVSMLSKSNSTLVLVTLSTLESYSILQSLGGTGGSWICDFLCPHHQKPSRLSSPCSKREWNIKTCSLHLVPQTACPHWGVLTVGVKAGIRSGYAFWAAAFFALNFSRQMALVTCPNAFRLRRLT